MLIEEPTIELLELFDDISEEARKEKLAIPPVNKMMYYWTRKPLIVGRAVALTSTLNDIEAVRELLGFRKDSRAYTHIPDVGTYKKKLGRDPSEIKILDPFAGGGNLIFEAKRLGLNCTCSDYNPLAYLLEKAILEFPVKYGDKLTKDFEKYAKQVVEMTQKDIGQFYKENDLVYFWVWCVKCPHCNQRVPLTNHKWIANTSKKKIGVRYHVKPNKNFETELVQNMTKKEGDEYTQKGGKAICISCKNTIDNETIRNDIINRKDRELTVIRSQAHKKRNYAIARESDRKLFEDSSAFFNSKKTEYEKLGLIPFEDIKPSHRDNLGHFGIHKWTDFFSDRQLLVLVTFTKNIIKICKNIKDKEYAKVISVYLGCVLSKHANYNSLGIVLDVKRETTVHSLSLRRPSFVNNHAELNPFEKNAGSIVNMVENIKKSIEFTVKNHFPCTVRLDSVTKIKQVKKYDLIITDPPYGYDVQYGELSELFYVWLYRCVKNYFPELPRIVPLKEDFCISLLRFENTTLAYDFFEKGFKKSFLSINNVLKDDGLLVVFFAHSSIEAWNILLESVRNAKLQIISSYAIHTESTSNLIARNKTSFMSSIIVVCRKLTKEKTAYFEDIIPETEDKIKQMIDKISSEKLLVLPITDLLIMVYGKVLEACTQFTELKSYEKNFEPKLETLIKGSQDFIMREIVTKLTGRNTNLIGPKMAFYLLTRIFFRGKMAADDAIKITKAITIDVETLVKDGTITTEGGIINLTPLHETDLELKPEELDQANLYQQLCYLTKICHTQGASKVSSILTQSGSKLKVDDLKKIVPLLMKSYRLRINKKQKLDDSEQEELKILETISDTWGGTVIEGSLDKFIGKK